MTYHRITSEERTHLWAWKQAGKSNCEIARLLRRSPSTIGRELKRHGGTDGYCPVRAQATAVERARREGPRWFIEAMWAEMSKLLRNKRRRFDTLWVLESCKMRSLVVWGGSESGQSMCAVCRLWGILGTPQFFLKTLVDKHPETCIVRAVQPEHPSPKFPMTTATTSTAIAPDARHIGVASVLGRSGKREIAAFRALVPLRAPAFFCVATHSDAITAKPTTLPQVRRRACSQVRNAHEGK